MYVSFTILIPIFNYFGCSLYSKCTCSRPRTERLWNPFSLKISVSGSHIRSTSASSTGIHSSLSDESEVWLTISTRAYIRKQQKGSNSLIHCIKETLWISSKIRQEMIMGYLNWFYLHSTALRIWNNSIIPARKWHIRKCRRN